MTLTCVDFSERHLAPAAELSPHVAAPCRLQSQRRPTRYTEPATILPLLTDLARRAPGLAALRNGQLVGFLLAMVLPSFRGKRSVYSPEWANGALLAEAEPIYQALYTQLSAQWVADGCKLHALTVLANDTHGLAGWYWQGFGLNVVDAVRDMADVTAATSPSRHPPGDVGGFGVSGRPRPRLAKTPGQSAHLQTHGRAGRISTTMRNGSPSRTMSCGWPATLTAPQSGAWAWSPPIPTPARSCGIRARSASCTRTQIRPGAGKAWRRRCSHTRLPMGAGKGMSAAQWTSSPRISPRCASGCGISGRCASR